MLVTHHLHDARVYLVKLSRIDGQDLALDGPDKWLAVLDSGTLSGFVGVIGSCTMPKGTDKVYHTTLWAQGWYCLFGLSSSLTTPILRPWNDSGGS